MVNQSALAYLKGKKLICNKCVDCPLGRCHNGKALHCNELEAEFPEIAIGIVLKYWEGNNDEREDI